MSLDILLEGKGKQPFFQISYCFGYAHFEWNIVVFYTLKTPGSELIRITIVWITRLILCLGHANRETV